LLSVSEYRGSGRQEDFMRKLFVLLAGLAVVAGLQAQTTGIAGTVLDAETRQPIRGATVCCFVANAQTDSLGNYLIAGLSPGRYRVRAIKTGYVTAYYPESVEVVHGRVTADIDFALVRTGAQRGSISGRVTDSRSGHLIVGAEVRASGPHGSRAVLQCTTGYRIDSLLPGKYRVSATANGYEPGCYPESVTVVAGQNTGGICFQLTPTGGQTGGISGWVFDAQTREPIVGATVCCGAGNARTNEHGYYIIDGLEPRRYQVRAMATGYVTAVYPESVEVVAGRVTENINFHLEPSGQPHGAIWGQVRDSESGEIIRGATVRAQNAHGSRSVTQCSTGYRLCGLAPGKYRVSATARGHEPGCYAESVTVVAGQITDHIDFELEPSGAQCGGISGFVTNARTNEPIMGALVVAEGPSRGRASTCQRGGYAIRELLAGRYVVQATARGFEPSGLVEVEVVAGRITTGVDFALEPISGGTGFITGRVRDSLTNAGINDAYVLAWGEAGRGSAYTESCGGYIIRELREGAYVVRACKRGYYHKLFPETVYVAAGDTVRNVNFLLVPVQGLTGGVSGFVFDGFEQLEVGGASVLVIGTTGSWEVTAGSHGDYLVDGLEPGDYEVEVQAPGYSTEMYPEPIAVEAGVVAAFISPALYPLTGAAEPRATRPQPRLAASPNPFSASTRIQFAPASHATGLLVLDRAGRVVRTLGVEPSASSVMWDGRGDSGRRVAEGIYFCRLTAAAADAWTKVVVTR
jgi:hypothetical protein